VNELDHQIVRLLVEDGRMPLAEIARRTGVSRAHVQHRVQELVDTGVIEQFAAIVDPEKLGKLISTFLDIKVSPQGMDNIARQLAAHPDVVSLYIMTDMKSLHVHVLVDSYDALYDLVQSHVACHPEVLSVESNTLLKRIKNRRGGARL
jgi:Lrp/AsnC family transcriptional regulator, leucine-responsive regulatory protein